MELSQCVLNGLRSVLSADYAALLAEEFGFNSIIDDEAAFDIYPP
jgi:translation initiation factor IF-2